MSRVPGTALSFPLCFKRPGPLVNSPEITEFGPVCSPQCLARGSGDDKQLEVRAMWPRPQCDHWLHPRALVPSGAACPGVPVAPCPSSQAAHALGRQLGVGGARGEAGPERFPQQQYFSQKTQTLILSGKYVEERKVSWEKGSRFSDSQLISFPLSRVPLRQLREKLFLASLLTQRRSSLLCSSAGLVVQHSGAPGVPATSKDDAF